ncbi:MAG: hypothetical protein IPP48_16920 [Chitinophagaceae bacterium]|nr:hypothetical protein [Chitinophagaceae bacterium]
MKKFLLLSCLFWSSLVKAQAPADLLNQWSAKHPIQKIYLQLDRESYLAGQTVLFKAYLSTHYFPDTINSTIYVELLDGANIIRKTVFPVFFSSATGSIDMPDSLSTGYYTLRSYSTGMISQQDEYFFQRKIFIYGNTKKQTLTYKDTLRLEFFPEGGNLVGDLATSVAFKATDKNGMPVKVGGTLYNSKNEAITSFEAIHDGMGVFDIEPQSEKKYYVKLNSNLPQTKYYLPEVINKGIVLSVIPHPDGSFFEIKQKLGDTTFTAAYMLGQMQHQVVFRKDFSLVKNSFKGLLNTKSLRSGIMQITVFNKNGMPLAERLCFVNNNEYLVPSEIKADTLDFSSGARNRFLVTLRDTVQGQISVAITDPTFDITSQRENNIVSSLLLTSDLKGYINNAAWYLSSSEDSVKNALDLLMMVNGWRRFKWTEIAKQQNTSKPANAFITLNGKATLQGTKKPFADKQLLLMINSLTAKNKRSTHFLQTDNEGVFKIDSLILFGKNRLLFSDIRGRKSQYIDINMNADTLFAGTPLTGGNLISYKFREANFSAALKLDYDATQKAKGLLLKEVTVKAQKKTPLEIVEENYTSGVFGGSSEKSIDLINSDEAESYSNIFDYLQFRVNGLQVVNDGVDYSLYYRQAPTVSSLGNASMTIYLDEVETDASVIASIPAHQIALVKVYSYFIGGSGNSPGGAISIYTKNVADSRNSTAFSNLKIYNGYTITKEFYAPDYKLSKVGLENDNRVTLDWRPQIFINNINPRIPVSFYNNNRTKKFKVVVEGMTTAGKLIWLEKIIGE